MAKDTLITLQELRTRSDKAKRIFTQCKPSLESNNDTIKQKLSKALSAEADLCDLFSLSEYSPRLKSLLQKDQYQSFWKTRFDRFTPAYTKHTSNVTYFDKLMGIYLAKKYEAWLHAGKHETSEAIQLGEEAAKRGIDTELMVHRLVYQKQEEACYCHTAPAAKLVI